MKKMSIKASILIPTLAVLIVGIILLVSIVTILSSATANDLSSRLVSSKVSEYANEFKAMSIDSYGIVSSLAPVIHQFSKDTANPRKEVVEAIAAALMSNSNMVGMWTCWEPNAFDGKDSEYANTPDHDATGRYIPYVVKSGNSYTMEPLTDYDSSEYYIGARDSGKPYITDPYAYDIGGKTTNVYTIAVPIKQDGVVAGVLGADILLEDMNNIMNAGSILEDGYLFSISPSGNFATHRNNDLILKGYDTTWLKDYSAEINNILTSGGSFSVSSYSDQVGADVMFLANGVMIGDTGRYWAVCGLVPQKTVNAPSMALMKWVIVIGVMLIVVLGLTVFLIVRNRLGRLPTLTATAEAMSLGDVQSSADNVGTERTKNEIVMLERAFAKMAASIKEQARVLDSVADGDFTVNIPVRSERDVMNKAIVTMLANNNNAMGNIRAAASQVASGADQIAQASQNLASGSSEQAATIEEFTATINMIQTMSDENAEISTTAQQQMQKVGALVSDCTSDMNQMLAAMREIDASSQNISKVIKVIDDIAFQTNILALNAAVEAARAGQHGKGFAVVADEVRSLASKSAEAAKETSDLIAKSIQSVNEGNLIVEKVSDSIQNVSEIAGQSAESVGQIYTASNKQRESMSEVTTGITQLSAVVEANAATAEQTAASSQEMNMQSASLDDIVSRFKLADATSGHTMAYPEPSQRRIPDAGNQTGGFALSADGSKY